MIWLHYIVFDALTAHSQQWCLSGFSKTLRFSCLPTALNNISNLGPRYKACTVQYGTQVFHCLILTCLSSFIFHPTPLVQVYEP